MGISAPLSTERCAVVRNLDLDDAAWEKILALDQRAFGVRRERLLKGLLGRSLRAVVHERSEAGFGYGMIREGSRAVYLGPVAAESAAGGIALIQDLLAQRPERAVFWDIANSNLAAGKLAQALGFSAQRPLLRISGRSGANDGSAATIRDGRSAVG